MSHRMKSVSRKHEGMTKTQYVFIVVLILWSALLLFGVLVSSVTNLMHLRYVNIQLVPHPDWRGFFRMDFYDHLEEHGWYVAKFGHLVGFGIFDVLLTLAFRRPSSSPFIAFSFAVFTELLQIPFGRDGRFYDVYIDTLGIAIFGFVQSLWSNRTVDKAMPNSK